MTIHIHNMRKKMSKFILLILISFIRIGHAHSVEETVTREKTSGQDILLMDNELSLYYSRGGHLVYDCLAKHWVCTGKNEVSRCDDDRKNSIKDMEQALPCAVIKKFENEKECQIRQLELINEGYQNRFCVHPEVRMNLKDF